MLVQNIMSKPKAVFSPESTVDSAIKECLNKDILMAPVVDNNKYCGILKISNAIISKEKKLSKLVKDVMITDFPVVLKDTLVVDIPENFLLFLPVIDNENNFLGIITAYDVLCSFKEEVYYSLSSLSSLIDSTNNGIVAVNKNAIITICNRAARRILGLQDNVLGKHIMDVIPRTKLPTILKTGQPKFNVKTELGPGKTLFANYSPIINKGVLIGAVAVFQDFSELESISDELNKVKMLNKQLDAIINSSYDGIWITDHEGTTLRVNDAIERITGLSREECIGRNMRDMELDGTVDESVTMKVLKEKRSVTLIQNVRTGKQTIVTGNPVFDDKGNLVWVVTNVRDISELNRLKEKLIQAKDLANRYKNEVADLKLKLAQQEDIVARSKLMQNVLYLVTKVAPVDSTVLITGESGVGKEVVARMIHRLSPRHDEGKFVAINCGAIPASLLESELFGYEKGAFTGAQREGKPGLIELADKGTLFLDEVSELPMDLQVKLLRVLQEQELIRVGGVKTIKIDLRVVAATNKNLLDLIAEGKFREDLYYRLNVVPIDIPPLRERPEDISALISHYLHVMNNKFKTKKVISSEAVDYLVNYNWPGNVRELINLIERLIITTHGDLITFSDLPEYIKKSQLMKSGQKKMRKFAPLKKALEQYENEIIAAAMEYYGSTRKAAKALGVSQSTVSRRVRRITAR